MPITIPVPNFRIPRRLIQWMQVNNVRERVFSAEQVFFKKNLDSNVRAHSLVQYARQVLSRLPAEMENLISTSPSACVDYASHLRRSMSLEVPQEIVDACAADQTWVVKMSEVLGRRIEHLEHLIVRPESYVEYAVATRGRVPEMEDRILFSEDGSSLHDRALFAFKLIERTVGNGYGPPKHEILEDQRLKDLMKRDVDVVLKLMEFLSRRSAKLPGEFHQVFAGDGERLFKLAEHLRARLPLELERTWEGAKQDLVQYAIRWVRGPLPESLEDSLVGDTKAVYDYAFQVIRGFSSPRLGDTLHNFMLMAEQSENVRRYVAECDRIEAWKKTIDNMEMAD